MAGHEVLLGMAWLETTLGGDSQLAGYAPGGVYRALAEPTTLTPYVVFNFQSGTDSVTMNGFRVLTRALFQVKAVGPANNTAGLASAAARIDALLGSPPSFPPGGVPIVINAVNQGWLYSIYRESPLMQDELVTGELFSNVGGMYRMEVGQIY